MNHQVRAPVALGGSGAEERRGPRGGRKKKEADEIECNCDGESLYRFRLTPYDSTAFGLRYDDDSCGAYAISVNEEMMAVEVAHGDDFFIIHLGRELHILELIHGKLIASLVSNLNFYLQVLVNRQHVAGIQRNGSHFRDDNERAGWL